MISINHRRRKASVNTSTSERGGGATASDIAANVPPTPRFVGSIVALATVLGVTRQSITRWSREPGCPGRRSDGRLEVEPWRTFLQNRPRFGGSAEGYAAKCQHIRLQCQKLEWEIAVLKRDYVPTADVEKWGGELASAIRKIVACSLTKAARSLVLCSVPDAEARLKDLEDDILNQLHAIGERVSGADASNPQG